MFNRVDSLSAERSTQPSTISSAVLDRTQVGIFFIDPDLRVCDISSYICSNSQLKKTDEGRPLVNVEFIPEYTDFKADVIRCLTYGESIEREIATGIKTLLVRISPNMVNSRKTGAIVMMVDVSSSVAGAWRQVKTLINSINVSVARMTFDGNLYVEQANDQFYSLLKLKKKEFHSALKGRFDCLLPQDCWHNLEMRLERMTDSSIPLELEFKVNKPELEDSWFMIRLDVLDMKENYLVLQALVTDITESKKKADELRIRTNQDPLTGLLNSVATRKDIIFRLVRMATDTRAFLITCDIVNFKNINLHFGHLFGDSVLCFFADVLRSEFPEAILGRIGGDEFMIFVEDIDGRELARKLIVINDFMTSCYDEMDIRISAAFGGVETDYNLRDYDKLFNCADRALTLAKSSKSSSYRIVSSTDYSVMDGSEFRSNISRPEALLDKYREINNIEDLVFGSLDILEKVNSVKGALRLISERIGRYFDISDIIYANHDEARKYIFYQWSKDTRMDFTEELLNNSLLDWNKMVEDSDKDRVVIRTGIFGRLSRELKSSMIVLSDYKDGTKSSIIFVDRSGGKTWENNRETLTKIAGFIFHQIENRNKEDKEKRDIENKLNIDSLTGLLIYSSFISNVTEYLERHGRKGMYLVSSDFSHFQTLNDIYGYELGDRVLKSYANAVDGCEDHVLFGRVSSDVFVGLIHGDSYEEAADRYLRFCEEFIAEINARYDRAELAITSGLYDVSRNGDSVPVMLDHVNEARKECKRQGSVTSVVKYDDELVSRIEGEKAITNNMLYALNNNEFIAYLQPKVSLTTGRVVGAEALVRWIRDDGQVLMPGTFIETFEKNGLIIRVDFAVLDQVLQYLETAREAGEELVPISVNFSRRHQENEDFVTNVTRHLSAHNVNPQLLEVEITESTFMEELETLTKNVEKMHQNGMKVSIDDFGKGYSSLSLLSRVNADVIKLDKDFLDNLEDQEGTRIVLTYLIKMLKELGFKVLTEGVENQEQLDFLREANCDVVQGYFYGKPMPISDFRDFLKKHNASIAANH